MAWIRTSHYHVKPKQDRLRQITSGTAIMHACREPKSVVEAGRAAGLVR